MTYPEISRPDDSVPNSENVYSFAVGTLFETPNGPASVDELAIGDLVRDNTGEFRTVLWLQETRTGSRRHRRVVEPLDADGRRTRFPGVRFVRGRPSDVMIQIMFGAEVMPEPQFTSQQHRPDYVAQFASSRARDDEKKTDQQLAAE